MKQKEDDDRNEHWALVVVIAFLIVIEAERV